VLMNASTRLTSAAVTGSMAWALMLMCLASCNSTFHGGKSVMSADFELAVKQASTAKPAEAASSRPKSSQCPSVLMFDGVDVSKDTIESKAKYWGEDVGVDGFFLNNVMASWEVTVPNDENSPDYVRLKHFQDLSINLLIGKTRPNATAMSITSVGRRTWLALPEYRELRWTWNPMQRASGK
jgi:hypothetical protein